MTTEEAAALLGGVPLDSEAAVWADLGCGEGTFTLALASLLPPGSVVHAMDRDVQALRRIPPRHRGVSIVTHIGDFVTKPWPFAGLTGVLLANSLHYVRDQQAFLRQCADAMPARSRVLVVEYNTDTANPWVPYPISQKTLERLLKQERYGATTFLGSRPSLYGRAEIYSVMVTSS